jgi:hypothetical protein
VHGQKDDVDADPDNPEVDETEDMRVYAHRDEKDRQHEPNTGFRAKAETTWLIRPKAGKMRM